MSYKITCYHHKKAIIKGDIEAETVIESCEILKTKKDVVSYLMEKQKQYSRYSSVLYNNNKRGSMPTLSIYTDNLWIHENTGEEQRETYWYKTKKV